MIFGDERRGMGLGEKAQISAGHLWALIFVSTL